MKVSDVKVRIYELAEELDISERTLINWLSRKGYPGARANDWLYEYHVSIVRLVDGRYVGVAFKEIGMETRILVDISEDLCLFF